MQDLGTLNGDALSLGGWINNKSQVVGWSCDSSGSCRAYLWEKKVMTDLNSLIPSDSNLYLMFAYGINDAGEIVGQAMEKSTGQLHAFLAIPRHSAASSKDTASAAPSDNSRSGNVAENVRQLQQRLRSVQFGSRFEGMR
jgi:probable HAF family extracellular repeat protein